MPSAAIISAAGSRRRFVSGGGGGIATLFTFTLEGTGAAANTVFTFAHGFKQGDVPSGSGLLIRRADNDAEIRTQADIKTTWGDGSAKHVLLAMELPSISDGATLSFKMNRGETHSSPGSTLDFATVTSGRTAVVGIDPDGAEAEWTYDVINGASAVSTGNYTRRGPLVLEIRPGGDAGTAVPSAKMGPSSGYNSTGGRIVTDLLITKNGDIFVDCQFRNDGVSSSWGAKTSPGGGDLGLKPAKYAPRITIDGTNRFSASTTIQMWYQGSPQIAGGKSGGGAATYWPAFIRPSMSYLNTTGWGYNYDTGRGMDFSGKLTSYTSILGSATWSSWLNASEHRGLQMAMGTGGDRDEIYGGIHAEPCALWIADGNRVYQQVAMGQAEILHEASIFFWDKTNSEWANKRRHSNDIWAWKDVINPMWSIPGLANGTYGDYPSASNASEARWSNMDFAHWPNVDGLPYFLRGRRSILDGMLGAACGIIMSMPGTGQPPNWTNGNYLAVFNPNVVFCQTREAVNALRLLAMVNYCCPAASIPDGGAYIADLLTATFAAADKYEDDYATEQGEVSGSHAFRTGATVTNSTWQNDWLWQVMFFARKCGHTAADGWLSFAKNFLAGGLLQTANGLPLDSMNYNYVAAVSSTYVSTWAQFGSQTAALIDSFGAWPTNDQQWDDDPTRVSAGVGMWVQMRGMSLALMKDYYPGDTQVQNAWTTFETLAEDMPAMQAVGFEYPQNGMRRNVVPVGYTRP